MSRQAISQHDWPNLPRRRLAIAVALALLAPLSGYLFFHGAAVVNTWSRVATRYCVGAVATLKKAVLYSHSKFLSDELFFDIVVLLAGIALWGVAIGMQRIALRLPWRTQPDNLSLPRRAAGVGIGLSVKRNWLVEFVFITLISSVFALWWVPRWQTANLKDAGDVTTDQAAKAENDARATLAQILGGLFLLAGLYFTWRRVEIAERGHITERFTRAIDQLGARDESGEPKVETRLGAIYALARIADESSAEREEIVEILTAYVRTRAPWQSSLGALDLDALPRLGTRAPDVQAAMNMIGRMPFSKPPKSNYLYQYTMEFDAEAVRGEATWLTPPMLELSGVDLRKADLAESKLVLANLSKAHLDGANLFCTNLYAAELFHASLRGAILQHAYLEDARLLCADLSGADLSGADLTGAKVDQDQVDSANGDETTVLPPMIKMPHRWKRQSTSP
jgi:hypothetical protein